MAIEYFNTKRYKEAIDQFDLKHKKGVYEKDDIMYIGRSYYALNELKKADSIFSKAIKEQPDNVQPYLYLVHHNNSYLETCNA